MTVSRFRTIIYIVAAIVSLAGLADATYLSVQALTGETLGCGGSPDCFRVLGSSYARIGGIPVALFGLLAYFSAFTALPLQRSDTRAPGYFSFQPLARCFSVRSGFFTFRPSCCTRIAAIACSLRQPRFCWQGW